MPILVLVTAIFFSTVAIALTGYLAQYGTQWRTVVIGVVLTAVNLACLVLVIPVMMNCALYVFSLYYAVMVWRESKNINRMVQVDLPG